MPALRAAIWCGWCLLFVAAARGAEPRPNLVAIVTDDQGQWALGAYGNRQVHTPHMDRLAREGALFENAFTVTPVCSPSRAAYMSGRWPTQVGITDYFEPGENAAGQGLRALTWPRVLQQSGYRTALIGKWHLGTLPEFHPTRMGFDHFMGFLGGGTTPMNPLLEVEGKDVPTKGPEPDVVTDEAVAFITAHRDRPFAVCLHFRAPHLPYGPVPDEDAAHYQGVEIDVPDLPGLDVPAVQKSTAAYYASVSSIDRNLGRLLAKIEELGLAENTLVTFTSDHGYNEGRHLIQTKGNSSWIAGGVHGPKRPNMWDTSLRVPLLARWPKVIRPGTRVGQMVSNIDTFRTMLGALGVPLPASCAAQGRDTSPLLRGESLPPPSAVYAQYDLHNGGLAYMRMIRTERYKYVKFFRANLMDEFYDLESDPEEAKNLLRRGNKTTSKSDVLKSLQKQLAEWQISIDDPILKPTY